VGGEKEEERKAGRHGVTVYQLILIRLHTDAESHAIFLHFFYTTQSLQFGRRLILLFSKKALQTFVML